MFPQVPWVRTVSRSGLLYTDKHTYLLQHLDGIKFMYEAVRDKLWPIDVIIDLQDKLQVRHGRMQNVLTVILLRIAALQGFHHLHCDIVIAKTVRSS